MFKLDFKMAKEPEIKLPTSTGSSKKQENSRKTSSALLSMPKTLTVWLTTNCGPFFQRFFLRNLYAGQAATVRMGHGTTNWFQIRKGVHQGCLLSPCLFNLMQSTSWETLDYRKQKLESRLLGEISITSDMQMIPPLWQKVRRRTKEW